MKKRILASLVCLCLIVGLLPTVALAANSTQNEAVAEILNENGAQVEAFATEEDLAKYLSENLREGNTIEGPNTLRLLADVTLSFDFNNYATIYLEDGAKLDLNRNKLTFTDKNLEVSLDDGPALLGINSQAELDDPCIIKNGTIVVELTQESELPSAAIWRFYGPLVLESVEIKAKETSALTAAIFVTSPQNPNKMTLENCTIDTGKSPCFLELEDNVADDSEWIELVSGSYPGLNIENSEGFINLAAGSTSLSLEKLPDDVAEGTTVITSDDTTAIIVKDGAAYTYDTLKDAVAAADGKTEILLVKQPGKDAVEIPDGTNLTLKPLDENTNINMGDIPLVDEDGNKLEITEEGTLKPAEVSVTGVTLNKSEMSLTVGGEATLTATVAPENATNKAVTWRSDNDAVATVDSNGKVTAVSSGTATITAKAGDKAATCAVTVTTYTTGGGSYEPSGDYLVSVDKATGGKVTVNPGRADKGDTVKLTEKSNGKFTFKMPGSKVTVEAVFVKEDSEKPVVTLPFADVNKGDWFYDAVEYVYSNDLMNGTSATAFSPYLTTSRAMMLTMLARYDGVDTTTGSTWYEAGAVWAVAEGISDGTNLEADLTREQLVTMLWRYTGSPVVESDLSAYPDGGAVSDWAVNAMIWATQTGVITGNGAGALAPQGTATRAEVATILARFCAMER